MLANAAELILLLNLRLCSIQKNIHQQNNQHDMPTLTLFTLRSIFGTARMKLVPVPLFWFFDYLFS